MFAGVEDVQRMSAGAEDVQNMSAGAEAPALRCRDQPAF